VSRWPEISRYLRTNQTSGTVDYDYVSWHLDNEQSDRPVAELAVAHEQWADFFRWRLSEQAGDRVTRHIEETWTDDMVYACQRAAARARGEHPGGWVPQHERRPDLDAADRAIADEVVARLDAP
jgi:hypothetical protein